MTRRLVMVDNDGGLLRAALDDGRVVALPCSVNDRSVQLVNSGRCYEEHDGDYYPRKSDAYLARNSDGQLVLVESRKRTTTAILSTECPKKKEKKTKDTQTTSYLQTLTDKDLRKIVDEALVEAKKKEKEEKEKAEMDTEDTSSSGCCSKCTIL